VWYAAYGRFRTEGSQVMNCGAHNPIAAISKRVFSLKCPNCGKKEMLFRRRRRRCKPPAIDPRPYSNSLGSHASINAAVSSIERKSSA